MRILVIDPDLEAAALLVSDLDEQGHKARAVPSLPELASEPPNVVPDVVVACLAEPADAVLDALEQLHATKRFRSVPVLFTGSDGDGFAAARERFPKASFARRDALLNAIASLNA